MTTLRQKLYLAMAPLVILSGLSGLSAVFLSFYLSSVVQRVAADNQRSMETLSALVNGVFEAHTSWMGAQETEGGMPPSWRRWRRRGLPSGVNARPRRTPGWGP